MTTPNDDKEAHFLGSDWPELLNIAQPTAEKIELGRALRKQCPRSSHATWVAKPDREDPISLLQFQDSFQHRLPDLLPVRYGRMMASPLAFFRGSALVMANDLVQTPQSGLMVQCSGDCHLSNFGTYATPERNIVFDLNDFDETLPGPWEWDLKRLTASIAVAAKHKGFSASTGEDCVRETVREYRKRMEGFAAMGSLELWYHRLNVVELVSNFRRPEKKVEMLAKLEKLKQKRTHDAAVAKLTQLVDGRRRIVDTPPLIVHHEEATPEFMQMILRGYLKTVLPAWQKLVTRYHFLDAALKTVGVGSVGTVAGIILLKGEGAGEDTIFLQIKQASESVLERFVGKSAFSHHGQRIVVGQRLLQAASDMFLGWTTGPKGRHYYVRQLMDVKGSIDIDDLDAMALGHYGGVCGYALARAHARTGDAAMLRGYMGTGEVIDEAITKFAMSYAQQNERDYQLLLDAIKKGKIAATPGI